MEARIRKVPRLQRLVDAVSARVLDGRLVVAKDTWAPDVIDDAVDELIETVLRKGGRAVVVPSGDLADAGHVGAVLRY